jgi:hypothetical protein
MQGRLTVTWAPCILLLSIPPAIEGLTPTEQGKYVVLLRALLYSRLARLRIDLAV